MSHDRFCLVRREDWAELIGFICHVVDGDAWQVGAATMFFGLEDQRGAPAALLAAARAGQRTIACGGTGRTIASSVGLVS